MLADQVARYVHGGPARIDQGAAVGEPPGQPIPLGLGSLGEPAQVDLDALGAAHQRGQRATPERRVLSAGGRGAVQVTDQPGVGSSRGGGGGRVGVGGNACGQAARCAGKRRPDGGGDRVERADRRIGGIRPRRQVRRAGPLALTQRRVLAVVTGQIHVRQVQVRIAAVQLQVPVADLGRPLEHGQVRLVVTVSQRLARPEPAQARPDALGRQVLYDAVVLVPAAVLAHLGNGQVKDGTKPWMNVGHARQSTRAPPAPGEYLANTVRAR